MRDYVLRQRTTADPQDQNRMKGLKSHCLPSLLPPIFSNRLQEVAQHYRCIFLFPLCW